METENKTSKARLWSSYILQGIIVLLMLMGVVATHIIHEDPMTMLLMPVIFGIFVWVSLWLRHKKLSQMVPLSK